MEAKFVSKIKTWAYNSEQPVKIILNMKLKYPIVELRMKDRYLRNERPSQLCTQLKRCEKQIETIQFCCFKASNLSDRIPASKMLRTEDTAFPQWKKKIKVTDFLSNFTL